MSTVFTENLSRIGLAFDVLAFFMVAPEIVGEKRLKKIQMYLISILWWLSLILFAISGLGGLLFALAAVIVPVVFVLPLTLGQIMLSTNGSGNSNPLMIYVLAGIGIAVLAWLSLKTMHLVEVLARNGRIRRLFMRTGVTIFILGALAQFLGTF